MSDAGGLLLMLLCDVVGCDVDVVADVYVDAGGAVDCCSVRVNRCSLNCVASLCRVCLRWRLLVF